MEYYKTYKFHLKKHSTIYREVKTEMIEAGDCEYLAVIHMGWAVQHKISEIKEVQSAYFNGRFYYEIHTLYIYTLKKAVMVQLPYLMYLTMKLKQFMQQSSWDYKAERKGKTKIVVVSDSPTDQYRNAKKVFLIKRLATELGICIRLLFIESSQGNSPCNRVGENINKKKLRKFSLGIIVKIT